MKTRRLAFIVSGLIMAGCASGNCRKNRVENPQSLKSPASEAMMSSSPNDRVRVFKYDGSLLCQQGEAVSVEDMRKQLGEIQVYRAENKHDGQMHVQRCGSITGKANVYEIDRKDLDQAKKLGFQLWTFE